MERALTRGLKKVMTGKKSKRLRKSLRKAGKVNEKLIYALTFLLRFCVLAIPLYLVLWLGADFSALQKIVTGNVLAMLPLFGVSASADGFDIITNTAVPVIVNISPDCTGWKSVLAYAALVLAVPNIPTRRRALGLSGALIIHALNVLRISSLIWIEIKYGVETFLSAHTFLLKLGFPAAILLVWLCWLFLADESKAYMKRK
ncbi:MAG: exosortase/archaeosortase family protein [Candidatus Aenigmatarchaeota archaeon]